ncbi:hypothetical protein [Stratiformator vulcanicus]|uniref:Uncharacterized protein n=1 Tax=Stratiformator vulcanicus TaxID=2527980 RepID=A0A517QW17_9PLAN|nr:hypothetical protein [Stratiformator vulcanicus]QDT35862.1 hypothetical protein Pan189_02150 [Stratiformator vulcanicus]
MNTYTFDLIVDGFDVMSDNFADRLYESSDFDLTPGIRNSRPEIGCTVEATSFGQAVQIAITAVKQAEPSAKIVSLQIDGEDLSPLIGAG